MEAPPPVTPPDTPAAAIPPIEPTAQGSFAKTPFPHLLVYALERGLSGTFELHLPREDAEGGAESLATVLVIQGAPAKVRTTEGVHFLGDVMLELGLVSAEAVKASQERMAESPRLQGQILLELGAVDEARLDAGIRAQLERKVEHLFTLPVETVFSYFDGIDNLQRFGGSPTPVDPLPALWRGVRDVPAWEHVDATLRRIGSLAVRVAANAQLERFQFARAEAAAVDLLRQRPLRIVELANAKVVGPSVAQLLIYLLVISKQLDLVETPSMRAPVAPPAIPPPAPSATGQAFARVQLQAKPIRVPLVVEEAPVAPRASDGRIASPLPQLAHGEGVESPFQAEEIPSPAPAPIFTGMPPAPAPPSGLGLDIGSMISTTIRTSMPPPMLTPDQGFAPAGQPSSTPMAQAESAAHSEPAQPAVLTAEQSVLKQKILERAAQISSQDYFQMLGLDRHATPETVQKAFIGLAKVWHPDRLPAALVDVKDACSKVFTHLTEANATLCDPERKAQYMTLLKDGGATPDDQAKIQAILEAAMEFQKAEIVLKRNDMTLAYELAKKAHTLDPEQADYLAMVTWLEAQRPEWIGREKTLEKIAVLDRCIKINARSERAYFWRGMLYKRIEEANKALKDFKKAGELNPRNLDAVREVRLHNIRGGQTKAPPGGSVRPSAKPPPETIGGLFGKFFKK